MDAKRDFLFADLLRMPDTNSGLSGEQMPENSWLGQACKDRTVTRRQGGESESKIKGAGTRRGQANVCTRVFAARPTYSIVPSSPNALPSPSVAACRLALKSPEFDLVFRETQRR